MCDHKVAVPTRGTAERPRKSHNYKMQNMFYIVMEHVVPLTKVNHPVPPFLCPSRKESAVAKETGRTEDPARVFLPLCFLCFVPLSLHPPAVLSPASPMPPPLLVEEAERGSQLSTVVGCLTQKRGWTMKTLDGCVL